MEPKDTVEIYAKRMSISPAVLHDNLNDVEWLQSNLLAKVPLAMIRSTLETADDRSLRAVRDYLSERFVRTA